MANPGGGGAIGIWTNWKNHLTSSVVAPQPVIINNTITDNVSVGATGIFNWRSFPVAINNIFWDICTDPSAKEVDNLEMTGTNNGIIYAYFNCIKEGMTGVYGNVEEAGNISDNPGFMDDTYALSETSSCVGTGIESLAVAGEWFTAPEYDLNGSNRPDPADNCIDIGAIESDYAYPSCGVSTENFRSVKYPLLIYPNPVSDQFQIRMTDSRIITRIEILDVSGRNIRTFDDVGRHEIIIPRGKLLQGIYFLKVYAGEILFEKIIVR